MSSINIEEALKRDEDAQLGYSEYQKIEQKANNVAEEISTALVETIVKEENKFNITMAFMAVAKTFTHLASYLYDNEEEFLTAVTNARTLTVSDVIPALLDPQPCGECEACKNGNPMECINPAVRGEFTESRFLPILCNMIIEYDTFNKVMYMHTVGKQDTENVENIKNDVDVALEEKEEE